MANQMAKDKEEHKKKMADKERRLRRSKLKIKIKRIIRCVRCRSRNRKKR